jgi:hypothetical protein
MSKTTNGSSPAGIQHPSERHGNFWAERCAQSQQAFDRLQEHLSTRPRMDETFDELDSGCVELAREFRVLADADSPRAEMAGTALREARARRDAVRREWGRTHDELRERVRAYADAEILGLKKVVMESRLPTLWRLLRVEYAGGNRRLDGEREIDVKDSFRRVNAAVQQQLEFVREADRLRERPLGELLAIVAESGRHFSECRDFPEKLMEERRVPASQFRELQGAAAAASASVDPLTAQRGRFWAGPF